MNLIAYRFMKCPIEGEQMFVVHKEGGGDWCCPGCRLRIPYRECGEDPWRELEPGIAACARHWGHDGYHVTADGVAWFSGPDGVHFDLSEADPEVHRLAWGLRDLDPSRRITVDGVPLNGPRPGEVGHEAWVGMRQQAFRALGALEKVGRMHGLLAEVRGEDMGRIAEESL